MKNKNKKNQHERYHIPNLKRALEVFELLAEEPQGMGMSEISRTTGYSKNSIFRIICTLEDCGYVIKNTEGRKFRISRKLAALGYASFGDYNIVEKSMDVLRALRDEIGETAMLGTLLDSGTVLVEQAPGRFQFKFLGEVGMVCPLHTAAPSKAILAYLPKSELDEKLKKTKFTRYTDKTICRRSDFEKELSHVKKVGYGLDKCEQNEGVNCVGAPLFDAYNYPVGAIWITGPSERLKTDELDNTGKIVRSYADKISERIGWHADLHISDTQTSE